MEARLPPAAHARPKSVTTTRGGAWAEVPGIRTTLAVLKSRCTTPPPCAAVSAAPILAAGGKARRRPLLMARHVSRRSGVGTVGRPFRRHRGHDGPLRAAARPPEDPPAAHHLAASAACAARPSATPCSIPPRILPMIAPD